MEGVDAPSYMDSVASWHPATRAVEAAIMHVRGVTSSQGGVSARMLSGNELVPTTGYRSTKSSSVLHTLLCSRGQGKLGQTASLCLFVWNELKHRPAWPPWPAARSAEWEWAQRWRDSGHRVSRS